MQNNNEWHVMFDLETFGVGRDCMVNELGWAVFDPWDSTISAYGSTLLNLDEQARLKRTIDHGTFQWWLSQTEDARNRMVDKTRARLSVSELGQYIHDIISWDTITGVWSHGLLFDIPIIEHLCAHRGDIKVPWSYRNVRDTRTLFALTGLDKTPMKAAHNAREDAMAQALMVQRAYKSLPRPVQNK